ncbi:MAG: hypothetical protein R3223_00225 [Longimicrobiales bacterium]|nr:hypothetical protein [Longimicrobiales bacterium]
MQPETREFLPPRSMTPSQVADHLARLVWESFSDFITDGDAEMLLGNLGLTNDEGVPADDVAEELLIFLMWAHTRAVQLAFVGHAPTDLVQDALDEFHAAVFEDMQAHGTPASELPLFEQRVGARYAQYHESAAQSDQHVGESALRAFTGGVGASDAVGEAMARRAIMLVDPLRDFLEEVELVGDGS